MRIILNRHLANAEFRLPPIAAPGRVSSVIFYKHSAKKLILIVRMHERYKQRRTASGLRAPISRSGPQMSEAPGKLRTERGRARAVCGRAEDKTRAGRASRRRNAGGPKAERGRAADYGPQAGRRTRARGAREAACGHASTRHVIRSTWARGTQAHGRAGARARGRVGAQHAARGHTTCRTRARGARGRRTARPQRAQRFSRLASAKRIQ